MDKLRKVTPRFAICIRSDDADMLTPRMLYQILPDASAARSGYVRVIDNEGEDYLYPAKDFILIDLPRVVERTLKRIALSGAPATSAERPIATMRQKRLKQKAA